MEMIRLTLTDGTKKEMTREEMNILSQKGMMEAFEGKAIMNVEFYEEDGK